MENASMIFVRAVKPLAMVTAAVRITKSFTGRSRLPRSLCRQPAGQPPEASMHRRGVRRFRRGAPGEVLSDRRVFMGDNAAPCDLGPQIGYAGGLALGDDVEGDHVIQPVVA